MPSPGGRGRHPDAIGAPEPGGLYETTLAVVLAGGRARRMGGGDKPLRLLAGRPLLAHVLDRVRPQCRRIAVSANGDAARFAAWDLPVLPDSEPGGLGPLAGILAALDHAAAADRGVTNVLSVPGDAPFLPVDLLSRLAAARDRNTDAVAVACSGGRTHAVVALWPIGLREPLRAFLRAGGRRATDALALGPSPPAVADWPSERVDPFLNVNDPVDLAAAEALL